LQKEPGKRYASALALAEDLHRFLTGQAIQARPVSSLERIAKWVKRKPTSAGLIGVSCFAVVGFVAWVILDTTKTRQHNQKLAKEIEIRTAAEQRALKLKKEADTQKQEALTQKKEAENRRKEAMNQSKIANQRKQEAIEATKIAKAANKENLRRSIQMTV